MGVQPLPGSKQSQSVGNHSGPGAPLSETTGGHASGLGFGGRGQTATEQLVQMQDKLHDKERDPAHNLG